MTWADFYKRSSCDFLLYQVSRRGHWCAGRRGRICSVRTLSTQPPRAPWQMGFMMNLVFWSVRVCVLGCCGVVGCCGEGGGGFQYYVKLNCIHLVWHFCKVIAQQFPPAKSGVIEFWMLFCPQPSVDCLQGTQITRPRASHHRGPPVACWDNTQWTGWWLIINNLLRKRGRTAESGLECPCFVTLRQNPLLIIKNSFNFGGKNAHFVCLLYFACCLGNSKSFLPTISLFGWLETTCHARRNVSETLWIHPSGKELIESTWQGDSTLERWLDEPSICHTRL